MAPQLQLQFSFSDRHWFESQLPSFRCGSLLMHPGRQQQMTKSLGACHAVWECQVEFLAPGVGQDPAAVVIWEEN